jgi:hypothetical protein
VTMARRIASTDGRCRVRLHASDRAMIERLRRPGETTADALHRVLEEALANTAVLERLRGIEERLGRIERLLEGGRPATRPAPVTEVETDVVSRQLERLRASSMLADG